VGRLLAISFSTTTGGAGTGGRLSIHVRHLSLPCTLSRIHTNAGVSLRKSVEKAWKWGKVQREVANSLDEMVSKRTLQQWEEMVAEYKLDRTKPNPFEEPEACTLVFFFSLNSIVC